MSRLALALTVLIAAATPGATMGLRLVPVSDPRVAVMGRVDRPDPARIRFGYPGVTVRVRLSGTSLAMRVACETPNSHLSIFVDGAAEPRIVRLPKGESDVTLARGLAAGSHSVEVVHRTETWMGVVTLRGMLLESGADLLPADP